MIKRITIKNFKSLENVTVELGDVTVLVGRSGTGKTNFVDAIRYLRDFSVFYGQTSKPIYQNWQKLSAATSEDTTIKISLDFQVHGIVEEFCYSLSIVPDPQKPPVSNELLRLGDNILFHQMDGKWLVEPSLVQVPKAGPPALGRIPSISEVVIAYTAVTSSIGCYHFPATVLTSSNNASEKKHATSVGLLDDASNYLAALKEIVMNLRDLSIRKNIMASLQRINPLISAVELDSIQGPKNVIVGHKLNGKTLSLTLDQESDGFRRFYAHLLALYQQPPKQTLFFEEPENGIYPGALSLLADEFKAAPATGRGQVVLTTHSPRLLDHFDVDQIRVVELDGFQTRIGKLAKEQREALKENLLEPGELLTVDPARIDEGELEGASDA